MAEKPIIFPKLSIQQERCLILREKEGKTDAEIGKELGISPQTVRAHLKKIKQKFEEENKIESAGIAKVLAGFFGNRLLEQHEDNEVSVKTVHDLSGRWVCRFLFSPVSGSYPNDQDYSIGIIMLTCLSRTSSHRYAAVCDGSLLFFAQRKIDGLLDYEVAIPLWDVGHKFDCLNFGKFVVVVESDDKDPAHLRIKNGMQMHGYSVRVDESGDIQYVRRDWIKVESGDCIDVEVPAFFDLALKEGRELCLSTNGSAEETLDRHKMENTVHLCEVGQSARFGGKTVSFIYDEEAGSFLAAKNPRPQKSKRSGRKPGRN